MPTKEQVIESLEAVLVPATKRSIVGLNLVRDITISDGKVNIALASTGLIPGAQDWIKNKTREAIEKLPEVKEVVVEYSDAKAKDLNKIDHILAIMSGKGGVGKSLVSGLVAIALKRKGYEVGILDADITGPSIPKMFGLKVTPSGNESGLLPVLTKSGIEVMSINLLLPSEDDAVIWRGPLIGKAITQFWGGGALGKAGLPDCRPATGYGGRSTHGDAVPSDIRSDHCLYPAGPDGNDCAKSGKNGADRWISLFSVSSKT